MQIDDIRATIAESATTSAGNAVGFQVTKGVDMMVNGLLNALFGETSEDKRKEMNEHHDRLLAIVQKTPVTPPRVAMTISPREKIEKDVRDSNDHIRTALDELKKARDLSKCGVCKGTLNETIDFVGEATSEILDASEKVLAMQKLKDVGELPPDAKWDDLDKNQKELVSEVVEQYHPLKQGSPEINEEETTHGIQTTGRKKVAARKPQKGKPKSRKRK
jgi:hypothetical protein